jgi:hypothetical protein
VKAGKPPTVWMWLPVIVARFSKDGEDPLYRHPDQGAHRAVTSQPGQYRLPISLPNEDAVPWVLRLFYAQRCADAWVTVDMLKVG